MLPSRRWTELATTDLAAADMAAHVAVLPVAAVEQHGPHLPLGTDAYIMEGYLDRSLALLAHDAKVVVLPVQSIGCSVEHTGFAGTLSLSAKVALDAWTGLAESVLATGCRRLVVVNSHGGNSALVQILAHELRASRGCLVALAAWSRFGAPDGLFCEAERTHGIHGGAVETSLMLHLRPDLVRREAARDALPRSVAMERDFGQLRAGRPTGFGWMAQDLSPSGAMGDATAASAEKGAATLEHGARAFVELLADVAKFDMARFDVARFDVARFELARRDPAT